VKTRHLQLPFALALVLGASSAHALGLGQIQVKSGLNEPLVAEIPILSAAPGEIEELEVRLASPEAFARVGLERPVGLTANLQMSVGRNAAGQPVIRVTTPMRFNEPYLTFLVEANWGRGSVVREYSALVDPPYIAPAVIRPLEAPSVAVAPVTPPAPVYAPEAETVAVEEPAPAPVLAQPEPEPLPSAPAAQPEPAPAPVAELPPEPVAVAPEPEPTPEPLPEPEPEPVPEPAPVPEPEPIAATPPPPVPAPVPVQAPPPPAPAPAADPGSFGPVADGQTLWAIADASRPDRGVTMSQMMLAMQRANPEAFIGDNINQLKRGAVLRIPARDEITALGAAEAEALVREQAAAWQSRRQPVPQPAESVESAPAVATAPRRATAPAAQDGRLEIVPPSGNEQAARGAQSGASGTGRGSELRAELTQTREDLAARESEVTELRSQLTELEQQQADSQRLIQMQDSQMKALQERLGQPDPAPVAATPEPATAPASGPAATEPAAEPVAQAPAWYMQPLVWAGGALVLLVGLVLALRGRRRESPVPVTGRRISDDEALRASLANARNEPAQAGEAAGEDEPEAAPATADDTLVRLEAAVAERPDDLETHISLLRHHYSRGDREAYDRAAAGMRAKVRSTLDPRWREAVVMGVALSPGNALFSQAGWNTPRFGDTGVMPASAPAAAPAPVVVPDLDEPGSPTAPAAPASEEQDEDWDRLAIAAAGERQAEIDELDNIEIAPVPTGEAEGEAPAESLEDDVSATKIELAKAYLDIGDIEGARGMLEEVLAEAGPAGRAEAQRLLKDLG
jgi:pilus assembly protein FimV